MTTAMTMMILGKVTFVLAAGLAAVHLARKSRASVRHLLLAATFAAAIAVPMASILVPAIDIAMLPNNSAGATSPGDVVVSESMRRGTNQTGTIGRRTTATETPTSQMRAPSLAAVLWAAGAAAVLLPMVVGLAQLRRLRRSGLPWSRGRSAVDAAATEAGLGRCIDVFLHEGTPGPLTFGTLRPVVLLPADATAWSDEDLTRAIVHELEHVRRRDWMSQRLVYLACACYWFHPLAWIAWRRFIVEAERACDDAVLRKSEATAYADQLVALATHISVGRQPLLAMASRADLSTRVAAVLDRDQPRGRAGRTWMMWAMAAAALMLAVVSPLRVVAQSQPGTLADKKQYRYDVASIKPCEVEEVPTGARGTAGGTNATWSPGRFQVPCVTAGQLIYLAYAAYGVGPDEHLINDDSGGAASPLKVRGGPDWVHSLKEKYRIEATAVGATERSVLMGAMLRTLLEERFKLKIHRDTETVDMLELRVAKGGLKLTPMKEGDCDGNPQDPNNATQPVPGGKPWCGVLNMMNTGGHVRWTFGGMPLVNLARRLSSDLKVFVIDGTDNSDKFVFRFEYQQEMLTVRSPDSRVEPRRGAAEIDDKQQGAPSLTAALEKIGLRLEKVKAPRGFLVIDSIERPTPDAPESMPPARAAGAGTRPASTPPAAQSYGPPKK